MQSLIIAVVGFGMVGAVLTAALLGLLMLAALRGTPAWTRVLLVIALVVVLLASSATAVARLGTGDTLVSSSEPFVAGWLVAVVAYTGNLPLVWLLTRRVRATRGHRAQRGPWTVLGAVAQGLVVTAAIGSCGAWVGLGLSPLPY